LTKTVTLEELEETVARMEGRLSAVRSTMVIDLYARYLDEKNRFKKDLPERRDFLLSCAGALMLIQSAAAEERG